jgi:hypothetical protein
MTERKSQRHAWARALRVLALCASLSITHTACARAADEASAASEAAAAPAPGDAAQANTLTQGVRKQIVETSLTLSVTSPRDARAKLERKLAELGGFVQSLSADGEGKGASFHFVVRVPEQKLALLLGHARALGSVGSESQQVKDVTREYVDVDARLRNLERTEQRLLGLLSERTGALADVLAIERELSRVRAESEALTAQLRALDHDVTMATLTVYIAPAYSAVQAPDDAFAAVRALWGDASGVLLRSAASLVWVASMAARMVLVMIPWLPLFALVWWLARRTWLRR